MARLGPLEHKLLDSAHPDINWCGMPLLCHDLDCLEDEWTCQYCGKVNPANALACGQGKWDGCGASRPEYEEPPRGVLHLPNTNKYLSEIQELEEDDQELIEMEFYPEPSIEVTFTYPGRTAKEHKHAIMAQIGSAFRKAISQWA